MLKGTDLCTDVTCKPRRRDWGSGHGAHRALQVCECEATDIIFFQMSFPIFHIMGKVNTNKPDKVKNRVPSRLW